MQRRFLSNFFQKETDRLLKDFLSNNPELLRKYVDGSLAAVTAILSPINGFMRHLLVVQGLDPDAVPGEKQRNLLHEALTNFFSQKHEEDFDSDYDLSWVQQKFEGTRKKLGQLGFTKEQFVGLTDLSNLGMKPSSPVAIDSGMDELAEFNQIAPETPKREIPLVAKEQERENLTEIGGDAIQALREAMQNVEKNLAVSKKKKGIKVTKKKMNKVTSKPKKVRRVIDNTPQPEGKSTLTVESDRVVRPPSTKAPGRSLGDIARDKKAQAKAAKEATPEFQAELKRKTARATELTNLMVQKGLVEEKSKGDQIASMVNWSDNNFDALERVVYKYAPTKDAVAENKFKGSFRRVTK